MLYERVKEEADKKGISLPKLATEAGIGKNAIYTWKPSKQYPNGVKPRTEALQAVADVLGVSVDYLLGNTDEMHTQSRLVSDADLEAAFEGAESFDGKPLSEHDKRIMKNLLISYMESKD
ncbi:helix-turn-helix transcriptional regulator [Weissella minor]|uniref:helix-turn-helix domain-containing protein n=1 Tax=Weissella minor TaxID=1620 RepID=UPI001BAE5DA0|nr:helix-turn-helix transcriptional regulator [Weissella minor]MBS0950374.1 helix-turn-helix transcriptional regulator [Weissella minor]